MMPRKERTNVYIGVEGTTEKNFFDHLYNLYGRRDVPINIKNMHGGDPTAMYFSAVRNTENLHFQEKILVIDLDKPISEDIYQEAKSNGFIFFHPPGSKSEFEAFLFEILEKDYQVRGKHKQAFYKKYCRGKNSLSDQDCERLFPKATLNKARQYSSRLDCLMTLCEKGMWKGYE